MSLEKLKMFSKFIDLLLIAVMLFICSSLSSCFSFHKEVDCNCKYNITILNNSLTDKKVAFDKSKTGRIIDTLPKTVTVDSASSILKAINYHWTGTDGCFMSDDKDDEVIIKVYNDSLLEANYILHPTNYKFVTWQADELHVETDTITIP
jgi:hypothetical protein